MNDWGIVFDGQVVRLSTLVLIALHLAVVVLVFRLRPWRKPHGKLLDSPNHLSAKLECGCLVTVDVVRGEPGRLGIADGRTDGKSVLRISSHCGSATERRIKDAVLAERIECLQAVLDVRDDVKLVDLLPAHYASAHACALAVHARGDVRLPEARPTP